jgi:hypothetical protein
MKRLVVAIAVLFLLVGLFVVAGWLSFDNRSDQTTVTIDKQEIQHDAAEAVAECKQLWQDAREALRDATAGEGESPRRPLRR